MFMIDFSFASSAHLRCGGHIESLPIASQWLNFSIYLVSLGRIHLIWPVGYLQVWQRLNHGTHLCGRLIFCYTFQCHAKKARLWPLWSGKIGCNLHLEWSSEQISWLSLFAHVCMRILDFSFLSCLLGDRILLWWPGWLWTHCVTKADFRCTMFRATTTELKRYQWLSGSWMLTQRKRWALTNTLAATLLLCTRPAWSIWTHFQRWGKDARNEKSALEEEATLCVLYAT